MFVSDSPSDALQQHTTFECRALSSKFPVIFFAISCMRVTTRLVGLTRFRMCTGMVLTLVVRVSHITSSIVEVRVIVAIITVLRVADVALPDDVLTMNGNVVVVLLEVQVVQSAMDMKVVV